MKKILVAIDIARKGGNELVIKTAHDLARARDGSLILLNVITPIPSYAIAEVGEAVLEGEKTNIDKELQEIGVQHDISDTAVREGAPATEILQYAKEIKADLIVLHSHDPDLSNYFLGSVAGRVVRRAHCSVHIVRQSDESN